MMSGWTETMVVLASWPISEVTTLSNTDAENVDGSRRNTAFRSTSAKRGGRNM